MTQPRQPKELSPKIVDMLNNRHKDEYAAHFFYRNAANWCDDANYKKAALLNALQLIDSSDKYQLLYFEQTYF